jgi:hypothetical protein
MLLLALLMQMFGVVTCNVPALCYWLLIVIDVFPIDMFRSRYPVISILFVVWLFRSRSRSQLINTGARMVRTFSRPFPTAFVPNYTYGNIHLIVYIISLHMHVFDLIVWFDFLLGSGFWLCNKCDASMPHLYTLPWAPYIAIIRSRLKKGNLMHWWGLYTLSDLRESNEVPSKVYFENLLKKIPSYLTWGVEVIWLKIVPFLNYPRWHDSHFKVHKCKVWFRISLMLTSYHRNFCFHLGP